MFEKMKLRNFIVSGLIFSILTVIFIGIIYINNEDISESTLMLLSSYIILGIFPALWFTRQFKKQKGGLSHVIQRKPFTTYLPRILILTVALILFSFGAYWLFHYVLSFVFPHYVEGVLKEDIPMPSNNLLLSLLVLHICVIGPIVEEFIFRGLLLKRLGAKINIIVSIIITNLLFGILHSDILGATIFGIVLSLLYLKSGNLLIPISIHILNNTLLMLWGAFLPAPDFLNLVTIQDLQTNWLPSVLLLLISVPIIFWFIYKNKSVLTPYRKKPHIDSVEGNVH